MPQIENFIPPEEPEQPKKAEERADKRPEIAKPKTTPETPRENNPLFKNLNIPHLEEADQTLLEKGETKIVLHPFYEMLLQNEKSFDVELWKDIKEHPEKYDKTKPAGLVYCEEWMIRELNRTMDESSEKGLSQRYWRVLEMAQEYQALNATKNSKDTYLFVLPKYHAFKEDQGKRDPELYDALTDIINYGANNASLFIESKEWSSGYLNESDTALMQIYIPDNAKFTVSGGYIGQCMNNLFESLDGPAKEKDWKVHVDVSNSTPVLFFEEGLEPELLEGIPEECQPKYEIGQKFSSIDEVMDFVERNSALNDYIVEMTKGLLEKQEKQTFVSYEK